MHKHMMMQKVIPHRPGYVSFKVIEHPLGIWEQSLIIQMVPEISAICSNRIFHACLLRQQFPLLLVRRFSYIFQTRVIPFMGFCNLTPWFHLVNIDSEAYAMVWFILKDRFLVLLEFILKEDGWWLVGSLVEHLPTPLKILGSIPGWRTIY